MNHNTPPPAHICLKKRKPGNSAVDFLHLLYENVYFQQIILDQIYLYQSKTF